jgi:hypothetical protein
VVAEDNDLLIPTAAAAFRAFQSFAASQGRALGIAEPAGAYRTYAVQADMIARPWAYGLNNKSTVGLAAAGHSGHGWGNRVDLVGTALSWIVANAGRFGFSREFGAKDPNHFQHDGRTATAGAGELVTLQQTRRTDMLDLFIVTDKQSNQTFGFSQGRVKHIPGIPDDQITVAHWMAGQTKEDRRTPDLFVFDRADFQRAIYNAGLAEFSLDQVIALSEGNVGQTLTASWLTGGAGVPIDYAALAKAVNDDAARRLSS